MTFFRWCWDRVCLAAYLLAHGDSHCDPKDYDR